MYFAVKAAQRLADFLKDQDPDTISFSYHLVCRHLERQRSTLVYLIGREKKKKERKDREEK